MSKKIKIWIYKSGFGSWRVHSDSHRFPGSYFTKSGAEQAALKHAKDMRKKYLGVKYLGVRAGE